MDKGEFYTVDEVAARLKISPETVRRWLRSGELRGIQLGARSGWRIPEANLDEFLVRKLAA